MTEALLDATSLSEIVAMLLPAKGRNILVPNVSVAEIVRLEGVRRVEQAPGWLRGLASWRGQQIPVISFEAINDDPFVANDSDLKAAVLNSAAASDKLPFYALASLGTPRMMRVAADEIVQCQGAATGPAELMVANASGEEVSIPDLAWIEQELLKIVPAFST